MFLKIVSLDKKRRPGTKPSSDDLKMTPQKTTAQKFIPRTPFLIKLKQSAPRSPGQSRNLIFGVTGQSASPEKTPNTITRRKSFDTTPGRKHNKKKRSNSFLDPVRKKILFSRGAR
ncbi:hypothetical protein ACFLZV_04815 [Candidatus Margulisiibacteriota bacterium]